MMRSTYYDTLFRDIADTLEADQAEFAVRSQPLREAVLASYDATTDKFDIEALGEWIFFAHTITLERLAALEARMQREYLSHETKVALVRRLELRRFYALHLLLLQAMALPFGATQTLTVLQALFVRDAEENGYTKEGANEIARTQVVYHWALASYQASGRPTYVPSLGLSEALVYTEFRDVPGGMLQVPNLGLYIEAPAGLDLKVPNAETGYHRLVGAFVASKGPQPYPAFEVLLIGERKAGSPLETRMLFDDALFHFPVEVKEGDTLGAVIERVVTAMQWWVENDRSNDAPRHDAYLQVALPVSGNTVAEWSKNGLADCARFVINTLLYVTLPDAEIQAVFVDPEVGHLQAKIAKAPKGSEKRQKLHAALRKTRQDKVLLLGSSVKINRLTHEEAEREGTAHGPHRKLQIQHVRRGHWRNQPYGPGRAQVRLKWIRPTFVGPKDAPVKLTTYTVE